MDVFLRSIINYIQNYFLQYSYFISSNYYSNLFLKYFSVEGFIIGFVFVLLLYFASAEEQNKAGFFKVLSFVAVVNSCTILFEFLNATIGNFGYLYVPGLLGMTDNIISGFLLTLVVVSCYKGFSGQAFLLGIVTFAALPLINFSNVEYYGWVAIVQMLIRIVLAGIICLIISYRKYFYTSWIWYFVFHILLRTVIFFTPMFLNLTQNRVLDTSGYTIGTALKYYASFKIDYIVFAVILIFAIIFEKAIIPVEMKKSAV